MRVPEQNWLAIEPTGAAVAPDDLIDDIKLVSQEGFTNLCWAACGEMILTHLGRSRSMRQIVVDVFGEFVDQTYWPHDLYPREGLQCRRADSSISDQYIEGWLRAESPIEAGLVWSYPAERRHVLIISGRYANGLLRLDDPLWSEVSKITLADLKSGHHEGGALEQVWYDIRPAGDP